MNKLEQLYEGKAKKVYSTEDPSVVIVSYKDDKANDFLPEKIPEHFARTFPVCLEQLRKLKDTVDRCRCGNERADQIGANR